MTVKFTNNASATLATGINSSVTSIQVTSAQGGQFPTLAAGDYFFATLIDSSNNIEIVKVTARSADTLTVVRGQDDTTAKAYVAGDKIELRTTAASLNAIASEARAYADSAAGSINNHISDTSAAHAASAIGFNPTGGISATDVQSAIAEIDAETPGNDGSGATGTWPINVSGSASSATSAGKVQTSNWVIEESGGKLVIKHGGVVKVSIASDGTIISAGNVGGFGTP